MQNYAPKPSYLKSLVLLGCALSLCFASTASLGQSIEELEAEAIRQKQATQAAEEAKRKAAKAEAERKAIARETAKRQAALATYPLTINTVPANAKVSIRNIEPKYRDGMHLPSGPYQVRVEAAGYETEDKWVELGKAAKTLTIKLKAKPKQTTTQINNWVDDLINKPSASAAILQAIEPEMVSIPAGSFTMGCVAGRDEVEGGCEEDEKPPHTVSLPAFQIGKYEVTFDEWDACERAKACPHAEDESWGRGRRPVINVSWNDITQKYIPWLNQQTGKRYRLPTEAEWEYAARAGGESAYPWGKKISCAQARYGGFLEECKDSDETVTVGSYAANAWGLYDTSGNVWEWVQDWHGSDYYRTSPASAPEGLSSGTDRVLRGGSWLFSDQFLRSAYRYLNAPVNRDNLIGFRLALG
ncbi:SUMF1/EgtB/PvdO family nonheme iron enzyme [uncultured Thiothrix sp.]|uniref:SUMF1/EgtB/PvdO family nonheme iron enzyme n=1 Tax=uncultured Thiothrix sp. TaxID=223185 RepID=UPI0026345A9C|nr:SUMF1/EgtB/PvdO family nonheme iron enzyme [uncultured Thiothrix sp.]HMT92066.1 SUMF1/EgtB/PvdO family nonheme iron enzyme [Thiolinea sp.]